MKKNILLKYILCMLMSVSLFWGSLSVAKASTNQVTVEEANAYYPIISEYLGLGELIYATILNMDGNGTKELITICGDADSINLSIWQQNNGEAKKTLSKELYPSQNASITLKSINNKYVIVFSTGSARQGNFSNSTEVFNVTGTEITFSHYINGELFANDEYDFSKMTTTPNGVEVYVNEQKVTPAKYAEMEEMYFGGQGIIEGGGITWIDLEKYTNQLKSLSNELNKLTAQALSSSDYPVKALNSTQEKSYLESLNLIRDVVNYGSDIPLSKGYNKNDEGVFRRFQLGFLESIDYEVYRYEETGEFAYYSAAPWSTIDPLIRERFGVEPDHTTNSMSKNGYYFTLFSRSSVYGASFSNVKAFQISDKLTLVSAECQVIGPDNYVVGKFPVQMILHHATINGKAVDQIYAYYENQIIPQSVINSFINEGIQITSNKSKVLVNGKEVAFDAYNINGNNYFKLRDIAMVLNGSNKQFDVTWDGSKNAINLLSNKKYTVVGGEMNKGDGSVKNVTISSSKIYLDGKEVSLTAYNINGNNYFKLRDLGEAINFNISWDGISKVISINTTE